MQVHSQLARGGLDTPAKEPDTVKGECSVNTLVDRGGRIPLFTIPSPQLLRLNLIASVGSHLVSSHSLLDQKEGSCVWNPQLVPWEGRWERPSS